MRQSAHDANMKEDFLIRSAIASEIPFGYQDLGYKVPNSIKVDKAGRLKYGADWALALWLVTKQS